MVGRAGAVLPSRPCRTRGTPVRRRRTHGGGSAEVHAHPRGSTCRGRERVRRAVSGRLHTARDAPVSADWIPRTTRGTEALERDTHVFAASRTPHAPPSLPPPPSQAWFFGMRRLAAASNRCVGVGDAMRRTRRCIKGRAGIRTLATGSFFSPPPFEPPFFLAPMMPALHPPAPAAVNTTASTLPMLVRIRARLLGHRQERHRGSSPRCMC